MDSDYREPSPADGGRTLFLTLNSSLLQPVGQCRSGEKAGAAWRLFLMRAVRETDVRLSRHASPWVDDGAGVKEHRARPHGIAPVWLMGTGRSPAYEMG
jgi:hypothetical protein